MTDVIGTSTARVDGIAKVTGTARYAYEHPFTDPVYLHPVQATVARGKVDTFHAEEAEAVDGVLAVLSPWNAPRLADVSDPELTLLQGPEVKFRGQIIGAVIATSPEIARHAQSLVEIGYAEEEHDTVLRADHPDRYPEDDPRTIGDDVDQALSDAQIVIDQRYSTPEEHNTPMEPHTSVARWDAEEQHLTLTTATQGPHSVVDTLAPLLGLEPRQLRVVSPHVGGGFGSKAAPHAHDVVAALGAMAVPGRSVKYAITRQQGFVFVGYRSPTQQHLRLGARSDGTLTAIDHESFSQVSPVGSFSESASSISASMYAAGARRLVHHLVPLDVPPPHWMRAPGEAPGMFALEVAMDELAMASGVDPVELRVRNDPPRDPATGNPWTSRRLVDCLHEGARQFGWRERDPRPGVRRDGEWLVGTGMASATYPHTMMPGTKATIRHDGGGRYTVRTGAADIGTGAWTTLTLISADALGISPDRVTMEIGDSSLPTATVAGGSSGTSSWGSAIVATAEMFRRQHGEDPDAGAQTTGGVSEDPLAEGYTAASFGAHFVEVRVHPGTGEVRVPRMRGVFSIGRIINPRTVRSQLLGGMVMGVSMALHEKSVRDPRFGHVVTQDLASYHVPVHADIEDMDASWLDDNDELATPMGSRGAGEIGIVGSAAAIANAVHHATGIRVRDLPITPPVLVED